MADQILSRSSEWLRSTKLPVQSLVKLILQLPIAYGFSTVSGTELRHGCSWMVLRRIGGGTETISVVAHEDIEQASWVSMRTVVLQGNGRFSLNGAESLSC